MLIIIKDVLWRYYKLMNQLYRVTYNEKGIYNELKNTVDRDTWQYILASNKINWLPKPPTYASNNKSFFTQKGYEKFIKDVLPLICNYFDKNKIKIEKFNNVENIIYQDEYQIVINE